MGEEFEYYSEEMLKELINRFQNMLESGKSLFFDIDELSAIIDHYFEQGSLDLLKKAIHYSLEQYPGNYEFLLKKHSIILCRINRKKDWNYSTTSEILATPIFI